MERTIGSRRPYRKAGFVIDVINFFLSIAIVILGVVDILNPDGNAAVFPILCFLGTALNGLMAYKYYIRKNYQRAIALTITAVFLAAVGIFGVLAVIL